MLDLSNLKRAVRVTLGTLLIYAVLVATHLGEFWPFSIYPMFSQAGNPWKRAIVQDVSHTDVSDTLNLSEVGRLLGETLPLDDLNVNTNDVANYLSKTEIWTPGKVNGIRNLVKEELKNRKLLVYQARGSLNGQDSIIVEYTPFFYLTSDTTILNEKLERSRYHEILERDISF